MQGGGERGREGGKERECAFRERRGGVASTHPEI